MVSPATILNFVGVAQCVLRVERDFEFTFLVKLAGDVAAGGIQRQAGWQIVGGEFHRPFAGSGNVIKEGMVGPDAENRRAVDARRAGACGVRISGMSAAPAEFRIKTTLNASADKLVVTEVICAFIVEPFGD